MLFCPFCRPHVISPLEMQDGGGWRGGTGPADPGGEVERMMRLRSVLLKAVAENITRLAAAEIIGMTPRPMRRRRDPGGDPSVQPVPRPSSAASGKRQLCSCPGFL
jgi:hypothetical protein